MQVSCG